MREQFGALALQAIYGALAACTDAGLLRRIEPAGNTAQFESAWSFIAGTHYREEEWQ